MGVCFCDKEVVKSAFPWKSFRVVGYQMRFKNSYRPCEDPTGMASVTSGVEVPSDFRPEEFEGIEDQEEDEDEEGLQYDLWEGQFSLTSGPPEEDLNSFCPTKAIKNARNQRKL